MKKLTAIGASDDLFDIDIEGRSGLELCDASGDIMAVLVYSPFTDERLIITAQYAPEPIDCGTWVLGVTQATDEVALPPWPIAIDNAPLSGTNPTPYSPRITIQVPDDVRVIQIKGGD